MIKFLNFFLLLSITDALISSFYYISTLKSLALLSQFSATLCLTTSIMVIIASPLLAKPWFFRVHCLTTFFLWRTLGAMPLFLWFGEYFTIVAALIELILLFSLGMRLSAANGQLFFNQSNIITEHSWIPWLRRLGIIWIIGPIMVLSYSWFSITAMLAFITADFIDLRPRALYSEYRQYQSADKQKTVHLLGMMHIGSENFYKSLEGKIPPEAIILMEGVTDHQGLLKEGMSYGKIAKILDLKSQNQFQKNLIAMPNAIPADIDLQDLDPLTIKFVKQISKTMSKTSSINDLINNTFMTSAEELDPVKLEKLLIGDLIEKRNQSVINHMDDKISATNHIVIPWGAAHMPGIVKALKQRNFEMTASEEVMIFSFEKVIKAAASHQNIKKP